MEADVELRHLRYFVAVAEELHFGRAAKKLNISQPPLSQQIRRLEQLLGCELFLRTSRAVRLTDAGLILLERANRLLTGVQEDLDFVKRVGRGESGKLRVGFVGSAMLTRLPEALNEYRKLYPGVQLHLKELDTASILVGLLQYSIDVGIVRDGDPTPGLQSTSIFKERLIAIVSTRHPLAGKPAIRPAELKDEPFVFYPQSAGRTAWERTMQVCGTAGFRPHVVQEAPHWVTIVSLVGAGLGVSIAPECIQRIAAESVVCRPLLGPEVTSFLDLVFRPNESNPVVGEFARITQGIFKDGANRVRATKR